MMSPKEQGNTDITYKKDNSNSDVNQNDNVVIMSPPTSMDTFDNNLSKFQYKNQQLIPINSPN